MLTHSLFDYIVLVAGVIIFIDALWRIHEQFSKRTPWMIRSGMVLSAVGALLFLHDPLVMGGFLIVGRALLILDGRQFRFPTFHQGMK